MATQAGDMEKMCVCLHPSAWDVARVLSSSSAYSRCRCAVGGNRCSLRFWWAEIPRTAVGVVAHKLVLSGVLCAYLVHDCLYSEADGRYKAQQKH